MTPRPQNRQKHSLRPWLVALALLPWLFSSCEESDIFVLLNPDGSGRITSKERVLTSHLGIQDPRILNATAISTIGKFVEDSEGVDAWEKLSFNITASGDIEVNVTALFPDISKLKLASTATTPTLLDGLKYDKGDPAKQRSASIQLASPITKLPQQRLPGGAPPSEKMIAAELAKTRKVWADAEGSIRPEWGNRRSKVTFHLPGKITSSSNLIKEAKNQAYLEVKAPKLIDTLGKIISDDEIAKEVLKTGGKIMDNEGAPPVKPNTFNKLTFGEEKPIRVEFTGGTSFFNYERAVATAKANPSDLMRVIQEQIDRTKGK